jgi:hypothetical protein
LLRFARNDKGRIWPEIDLAMSRPRPLVQPVRAILLQI